MEYKKYFNNGEYSQKDNSMILELERLFAIKKAEKMYTYVWTHDWSVGLIKANSLQEAEDKFFMSRKCKPHSLVWIEEEEFDEHDVCTIYAE
jgi:hypothetical protein